MPKFPKNNDRKAFTLIEVLIVMGIFSMVSLVALTTFLVMFRVGQKTSIENAIIQDARLIMNSIVNEIKAGSLDYEEYFSQCVVSDTCPKNDLDTFNFAIDPYQKYGQNHGLYAWQFKYGGKKTADGPTAKDDGFGGICQNLSFQFLDYPNEECVTGPLTFSDDTDTGQNPNYNWVNKSFIETNALCSNNDGIDGYQTFEDDPADPGTGIIKGESFNECEIPPASTEDFYKNLSSYTVNELYLINSSGDRKTILSREKINEHGDFALSKVEMLKNSEAELDISNRSLPYFRFYCDPAYACTDSQDGLSIPKRNDFNDANNIFLDSVPISPLNVNIKNLKFIIFPLEDPHRAFAEVRYDFASDTEPTIQIQPQVTILLEVEPSSQFKLPFISENFNLKLQTTVSAGVNKEIPIINEE